MMLMACSDFVDEFRDLEADSSQNWKPAQICKNWFDMVATGCTSHHTCKAVLDVLQLVKIRPGHDG